MSCSQFYVEYQTQAQMLVLLRFLPSAVLARLKTISRLQRDLPGQTMLWIFVRRYHPEGTHLLASSAGFGTGEKTFDQLGSCSEAWNKGRTHQVLRRIIPD
jgi:hypothetical protein